MYSAANLRHFTEAFLRAFLMLCLQEGGVVFAGGAAKSSKEQRVRVCIVSSMKCGVWVSVEVALIHRGLAWVGWREEVNSLTPPRREIFKDGVAQSGCEGSFGFLDCLSGCDIVFGAQKRVEKRL